MYARREKLSCHYENSGVYEENEKRRRMTIKEWKRSDLEEREDSETSEFLSHLAKEHKESKQFIS